MLAWPILQVAALFVCLVAAAVAAHRYIWQRRGRAVPTFKAVKYGGAALILLYWVLIIYVAQLSGEALAAKLARAAAFVAAELIVLPLLLFSCAVGRAIAWEVPRDELTTREMFLYRYGTVYVILFALLTLGLKIAAGVDVQSIWLGSS